MTMIVISFLKAEKSNPCCDDNAKGLERGSNPISNVFKQNVAKKHITKKQV